MPIIDKHNAPHYTWSTNCHSWVLVDTPTLSVKQELMPPGTKETEHYHHHAQQFFFILTGTATFYIDGVQITVQANKGIAIEPRQKHYIANETNSDIEFLVTSQPSTNNDRINS